MAIGLIGWARFVDPRDSSERFTVPAPPTDPGKPWLADFIRDNAASLAASFDILQWPPSSMAQGGVGAGCDGYGVSQRWNLGGTSPTRYGTLESLMSAVAALNAHGTRSYGDLVLHQILGPENGGPGVSTYPGADGKTMNGRGATTAGWFRGGLGENDTIPPFCPEDDVPDRGSDIPFGRELSYQHCHPAGVTTKDAVDLLQWMTQRTAFWGYRFDDVKGMYAPAVATIMNSVESPFYAEYFDGNADNLNSWATAAPIEGRSAVEDFTLHFRIQAACNEFDATQFDNGGAGYWQQRPDLAVGFVDNPDTDTSPGEQVIFNKGIAYAYLLTLPLRLALVNGKDYFPSSVWPGAYGLKAIIDNLCWISRTFAYGNYETCWVDKDVHAASRDGNGGAAGWSGGLLTAINFNTLSGRAITCQTSFGPNRWLHDYTGHHGDIWTDSNGNATFTIPSNAFSAGTSYVCFAPAGVSRQYPVASYRTAQTYIGDPTLDVMPALNGTHNLPQRLFCRAESSLSAVLSNLAPAVHAPASIQLEILGPDGLSLGSVTNDSAHLPHLNVQTKVEGWHTLRLTGNALPAGGIHFTLRADYQGK